MYKPLRAIIINVGYLVRLIIIILSVIVIAIPAFILIVILDKIYGRFNWRIG